MGLVVPHSPVMVLIAAFSRYPEALAWGEERAVQALGPIRFRSELFAHEETRYYERSMGPNLKKVFWVFEKLADPADVVAWKLASNQWEENYKQASSHPEERPLNLDPGYLTEAKLVLATTKDRDHRIYLHSGIFAEVTLHHSGGKWLTRPWTYPDYQRADYHAFFSQCRSHLRAELARSE